jgi:hypothetical protein
MKARIYRPAKTAMQSGKARGLDWLLEFEAPKPSHADPLMGWAGTSDTQGQVRLRFSSQESAIAYAQKKGIDYTLLPEQPRLLKLQAYADNFRQA